MWQVIIMLVMSLLLTSCAKKPDEPQVLYEKYRNSVVLIKNQYYYSITFDNGMRLFFTLNEKGVVPEIYETGMEAGEHASTAFGTGFFVDRYGRIATNRHVVNPLQQGREAAEYIAKAIANFKLLLADRVEEKVIEQRKLKEYYEANYYALDGNAVSNLRQQYSELESQIRAMKKLLQSIYFNPDNTEMQVHVMDVRVAYDNTYVTSPEDFQSCVVLSQSGDEDVDLAIIQLKNKHTPETVKELIPLLDEDNKNHAPPAINDDVYMIGYNYGLLLAVTRDGIKSQFTAGKVTQEPDSNRMLYSIPTLPGSSGSPVIDQWGRLVAVNFAKISDTQSFSFGIPKQLLLALMNSSTGTQSGIHTERVRPFSPPKPESEPIPLPTPVQAPPASTARPASQDEAYRTTIRGFVAAEDSRNFERLYGYFSQNLLRYWDLSNPGYEDLKSYYQSVWDKVIRSRNIITDIRKLDDNTFDMYTVFEYYDRHKEQTITKSSRVRFHFDPEGKIDEVYGVH